MKRLAALTAVGLLIGAMTVQTAAEAATSIATPTAAELSTLSSDTNAYYAAHQIDSAGVYKTLSSDLASATNALARGNVKAATSGVQQFITDTSSQSGKHIAAWAASVLTYIATNGAPPSSTVVPLNQGSSTPITTQVSTKGGGTETVSMTLPPDLTADGNPVSSITVKSATDALTGLGTVYATVEVDAYDASGNRLHWFDGGSVTLSMSLPSGAPTSGLLAATDDPVTHATQTLGSATITNATATFSTPHFSTFDGAAPPPAPSFTPETSAVNGTLRGISCTSSVCMAVGDGGVVARNTGSGWQGGSVGSANYTAVACSSTTCHITGDDGSIHTADQNGFTTEVGAGGHALRGVTCAGSLCIAVGDSGTMLAFNGSAWSPVTPVTVDDLNAVGCWSGGTLYECAAVGDAGTVLSSTDPTHTWTVEAAPSGNPNLYGVTCVNGDECHGVGQSGFVGPGRQTSGVASDLRAVACSAPGRCVAVGDGGTLIYTADGGTDWFAANSGTTNDLYGAECLGTTCRLVGASGTILTTS